MESSSGQKLDDLHERLSHSYRQAFEDADEELHENIRGLLEQKIKESHKNKDVIFFFEGNSIGSNLSSFPTEVFSLKFLQGLYLKDNRIESLPTDIVLLEELQELDLSGNQLKSLPYEITKLTKLTKLDLTYNQLPIPPEILAKTNRPEEILNFYFKHLDERFLKPLNEAKMLVVGQGSVGKTSIVRRLVENTFNMGEEKTEGISINGWKFTESDEEIKVNIWDFGGQEIMHATHQFFLTKRSLYLLVLDCRLSEEDNRLEYWIRIIESFGGDSPIIIAGNKSDQHPLDMDRRGLQKKYPNIKGFVEISCKSGKGLNDLKEHIQDEIAHLEHVHDKLLYSWFSVKKRMERMGCDYMPYIEYEAICKQENISDSIDQKTLIGFLHDLGIVLNFRDDPRLEDTNILNPEWVTNGVYKILNSNLLFQSKGVLETKSLVQILNPTFYPVDKHLFIMDIMQKFELCFDFEGMKDKRYLIPDLLSKEELYTGEWENCLSFEYHYSVLPGSIISRFTVRMHKYIYKNTYWRTGVVIEYQDNKALIKADKEDKKIFIKINGLESSRRYLLSIIRSDFDRIHSTIPKIIAKEKVPLGDQQNIVVDYEYLIKLEKLGEESFVPEGPGGRISVQQLLEGIDIDSTRRTKMNQAPIKRKSRKKTTQEKTEIIMVETDFDKSSNLHQWEKPVSVIFGFIFIVALLLIAILIPNPTVQQFFIFRVILALAASGIGAVVPGFINFDMKTKNMILLRAGGAIALFLIVYQLNPPTLFSGG